MNLEDYLKTINIALSKVQKSAPDRKTEWELRTLQIDVSLVKTSKDTSWMRIVAPALMIGLNAKSGSFPKRHMMESGSFSCKIIHEFMDQVHPEKDLLTLLAPCYDTKGSKTKARQMDIFNVLIFHQKAGERLR